MKKSSNAVLPAAIGIIIICLLCVCISGAGLYFYGDKFLNDVGISTPAESPSMVQPETSELPEWTVMVYADADDDVLEQDIWFDVNEMELVGSTPQMNVIVQLDRAEGAFDGDGDWTDTRRLYINQDQDLNAITSPIIESIGEADMGSPQTLEEFLIWSIQKYPAKKYAVIMSDHGGGWTFGWTDLASGSGMRMSEITAAMEHVQQSMGGQKFEVIGFDACLMGMVEVYGQLYPYTNYMVASEEAIPSEGLAYAAWLYRLAQNPVMDGRGLSEAIVSTYIVEDTILNLRNSTDEIAEVEAGTTLSAIESARMPDVINSMNQFISTIAVVDQEWVAQGREYSRSYYSIFGEDVPSAFIDLGNFAEIMATTNDPAIQQATDQLRAAISAAVVAEKHGDRMSGSNGISFHFPISDTYIYTELSGDSDFRYGVDASRFLEQSSWDEFLAFHYTGQAFAPDMGQASIPDRNAAVTAPGASELTVAPVQLSDNFITGDETISLSTTVTGNVSYIYFILYFYNPEADAYWVGDTSYVFSENTITIDGVNIPDYGSSPIQVDYEWSPGLFVLMDGQKEAFALFEPDEYINAEGVSTYSVYGQYTYINGSSPDDAKMVFDSDGNLLHIYALPDPNGNGISTPVEITPQLGDQFTDYVQSYYFDENNEPYFDYSLSEDVFTWGDQGFRFESRYPVDGEYAIGFYAADFDNNTVESYEFITYQYEQ